MEFLQNWGVAGAVIVVVVLFLKFLEKRDKSYEDFATGQYKREEAMVTRQENWQEKRDDEHSSALKVYMGESLELAKESRSLRAVAKRFDEILSRKD